MEIDFVTYGKPMKKRKGNIFASRILHIPDIEQKLTSPLKNVITGFDCIQTIQNSRILIKLGIMGENLTPMIPKQPDSHGAREIYPSEMQTN